MSDIDALAEGLHDWLCGREVRHGDKNRPDIGWICERGAVAIAVTPPVADLLRLAAIGRAVMALPNHYDLSQDDGEDDDHRWMVAWDYDYDGTPAHRVYGPTPDAAIAAALEEET